MLAAVITARNYNEAVGDIKKSTNADLVELRLDCIKNLKNGDVGKLIKICKKPVIITNRKKDEGGFFNGSENERVEKLKSAIKFRADYVDIEYSSYKEAIKDLIKHKKNTKMIVSYHNFKKTPSNMDNIYNKTKNLNPDLIKIVTYANSMADNFNLFELIKQANKEKIKIIAFCMGSYGRFSRILSLILGSEITYSSVDKGKESATGQLTLNDLINHYRIKKINKNTRIVGLIGNPVEHSWSHIIHNSAFDRLDFNAVYIKFRVDKLKKFIDYFKKLDNTLGFSVTIPHKIEVIKYLDSIDKKARRIGAVNTIVVKNKRLMGYNTDCDGAIQALKQKTELEKKNVVLIGAGGSTRALAYGLKEEKSNITISNRTIEKAKGLADYFDCDCISLENLKNIDYDILINTTPIGMYPYSNDSLVQPKLIKRNSVVFDIVFNPFKTKLLKDAEKRGCIIIPGFEMLIYGAMLQFKLWTGKNAPEQLMRSEVIRYLKNAGN